MSRSHPKPILMNGNGNRNGNENGKCENVSGQRAERSGVRCWYWPTDIQMRLTTVKLAKLAHKRGERRGEGGVKAKDERPNTKEIKAEEIKLHFTYIGRRTTEEGGRRKDKTAARAKDATRRFYSNCKHVEVELSERGLPEKLPNALFQRLPTLHVWYYRLLFYSINMITMSSNNTIC